MLHDPNRRGPQEECTTSTHGICRRTTRGARHDRQLSTFTCHLIVIGSSFRGRAVDPGSPWIPDRYLLLFYPSVTKNHQPVSINCLFLIQIRVSGEALITPCRPQNSNGQEMLLLNRYLFRTIITFLHNYDTLVRSSVNSMDSHVNHHIKATYSGFYFLGSLHFAYIGQTPSTKDLPMKTVQLSDSTDRHIYSFQAKKSTVSVDTPEQEKKRKENTTHSSRAVYSRIGC